MNKFLITMAAAILSTVVWGQVPSYSLLEAQQYAIEHAYSVQNKSLEVEKSKRILMENIARGFPQVFASADWTQNINLQTFVVAGSDGTLQPLTFGTPYTAQAAVSAEQLIFDGSYIIAVLGSQVLKENSMNELEKSTIDIRQQVASAYHLVLISKKSLQITEDNLVFITKNYEESKKMFEVGLMEEQDVDQFELIKSNLINQKEYATKQINIAEMLLKFQMGLDVNSAIELSDALESLMVFSQDGGSLLTESFSVDQNIDYRILETQQQGQNLNLKNENIAFLPKLKFKYYYGHNIFSANANVFSGEQGVGRADNVMQNFGFNLSVPIITGGSRIARIQQAKIQVDQISVAKKQLEDNLKLEYATAKAEYEYALQSYNTQLRNAEISKKIRDTNAKKFSEGIISSLDFTQAENQYQDALRGALNAANNVLDKKVKLEKIIGKYNN